MNEYIVVASDDGIDSIDLNGESNENAHVIAFVTAKSQSGAIDMAFIVMEGSYEDLVAYKIVK